MQEERLHDWDTALGYGIVEWGVAYGIDWGIAHAYFNVVLDVDIRASTVPRRCDFGPGAGGRGAKS